MSEKKEFRMIRDEGIYLKYKKQKLEEYKNLLWDVREKLDLAPCELTELFPGFKEIRSLISSEETLAQHEIMRQ